MTEHATIDDISAHLTAAGILHTKFDGACEMPSSIEFAARDADDIRYNLLWLDPHGWVLDSQEEPSPPGIMALPVTDPSSALAVAAAVEGVHMGAIDEFRTISYGDITYA